jgi:hypothetical protein
MLSSKSEECNKVKIMDGKKHILDTKPRRIQITLAPTNEEQPGPKQGKQISPASTITIMLLLAVTDFWTCPLIRTFFKRYIKYR